MNESEAMWKYGLIKVAEPEFSDDDPECMLVELYWVNGGWKSYCHAHITSVQDLKDALKDVERDGINEDFFNRGAFSWNDSEQDYDWRQNK